MEASQRLCLPHLNPGSHKQPPTIAVGAYVNLESNLYLTETLQESDEPLLLILPVVVGVQIVQYHVQISIELPKCFTTCISRLFASSSNWAPLVWGQRAQALGASSYTSQGHSKSLDFSTDPYLMLSVYFLSQLSTAVLPAPAFTSVANKTNGQQPIFSVLLSFLIIKASLYLECRTTDSQSKFCTFDESYVITTITIVFINGNIFS